ncbi:hypothetical protein [Aquimarina algiphila]|uniref:Uncharacterized protein n=1 Tax=Aquimarina algiphila TaxID=2047982 RepID=A0A554VRJ2_9FLAO|nr:hypothetical protein [Aquimarina algiphila]TSE11265.1 hypothetical protein FOF46_01155 [Aquimarina algiphila]
MDQHLFQDYAEDERKIMLRDNALTNEEHTYSISLSEEELLELKEQHAQNSIKLAVLEEKRKKFTEELNSEKKPISDETKEQLALLRTGVKEVTEPLYLIDYQEEGQMAYFNGKGVLIRQRPLRQNERQLHLITHQKSI